MRDAKPQVFDGVLNFSIGYLAGIRRKEWRSRGNVGGPADLECRSRTAAAYLLLLRHAMAEIEDCYSSMDAFSMAALMK